MKSTVLQGLPNILDQIKNYKTPTTIALPKLPSKQITQHMQQTSCQIIIFTFTNQHVLYIRIHDICISFSTHENRK